MQVGIPGKNVRLFCQMLKCLSRLSDVVYWEVYADKVCLKSVNSSISAFYSFFLPAPFFDNYTIQDGDSFVKVPIKPCLKSFRGIQNIEKCTLFLYEKEFMLLEMTCKIGGRKTFKIQLSQEEVSPIRATYDKSEFICKISTRPKLLDECLSNFSNDTEEMSIMPHTSFIQLKSEFVTDTTTESSSKNMNTELIMDVRDFDKYDIDTDQTSKLVFGTQEFKSIITFCDFLNQPIQICLGPSGTPIVVFIKTPNLLEADFVVATLQIDSPASISQNTEHRVYASNASYTSKIEDSGAIWTSELDHLDSEFSTQLKNTDPNLEDNDDDLVCSDDDDK